MKVLEVIGGLYDGGAETLVTTYVRMMDSERFRPIILAIYPIKHTANAKRIMESGVRIVTVYRDYHLFTRLFNRLCGQWYLPKKIEKILRNEQPDCIHIHSRMAQYLMPYCKKNLSVRLFYTCHSETNKYFNSQNKRETQVVQTLVNTGQLRLIALHEKMQMELNRVFSANNSVVINNAVDFRYFQEHIRPRQEVRCEIGVPEGAFLVGHIGRFAQVKNHAFLLEVFSEIRKLNLTAHLVLVGNGPLKKKIEKSIVEKGLDGFVTIISNRSDIPDLLHAMDVMVFPSFYEGLSMTLVEAQASGMKCVVSDSVNKASFLSSQTIPVSLKENAAEWARIVLDNKACNPNHGELSDFDMNREIHKLERLYEGGE